MKWTPINLKNKEPEFKPFVNNFLNSNMGEKMKIMNQMYLKNKDK